MTTFVQVMNRTFTISPDPFLVVIKDNEGNTYSCNHMDMIDLDGYSVHVPGIYDWYLYFNTYVVKKDDELQLTLPLHEISI